MMDGRKWRDRFSQFCSNLPNADSIHLHCFSVSMQEINPPHCFILTGNQIMLPPLNVNQTLTSDTRCQLDLTKRAKLILFLQFSEVFLELFHHPQQIPPAVSSSCLSLVHCIVGDSERVFSMHTGCTNYKLITLRELVRSVDLGCSSQQNRNWGLREMKIIKE